MSSPSNADQPTSSTPVGTLQESSRELQIVNTVLPSKGHIFAITGGSNQEHVSKNTKKDHQRRVLTVMPRVPLNRPAWSTVPITFDESDFQVHDFPHTDAFVVTANVAGFTLHNILIDNGSSADILFAKPFETMGFDRRTVEPTDNPLYGFGGKKVDAVGKKTISVSFEEGSRVRTEDITFDVVNIEYAYTTIFRRGVIDKFDIVIRQSYLCMKMPSPFRIISVHGDQIAARRIEGKPTPGYSVTNEVAKPKVIIEEPTKRDSKKARPSNKHDKSKVPLSPEDMSKSAYIGANLSPKEASELTKFLSEN